MPRVERGLQDGHVYHVINRGNGRQQVFEKDGDYKSFIDLMVAAKERHAVMVYAYCLMPNHFHLLISPEKGEDLSKWMQWLMTSHVRRYHRHHGTSGHVWQGRYKSFIVQQDEHLLTVARYIEGNPVRAMLADSAGDWMWSSHQERVGKGEYKLIDQLPINQPSDWTRYVDEPITGRELERLRQCVNRQAPLGAIEWVLEICKRLGLESTIRRRGRPGKDG